MLSRLLTVTLVLLPVLQHVQAGLFTKDSPVKMLDAKGFKRAMAQNRTAIVAFVAPWCGHCQRLTPEYEAAAKKLAPLVPLYAVDCDDAANKALCAQQGVKGFPTVKLFKKGGRSPGTDYQGERTHSALYNWGKAAVPMTLEKVKNGLEGVSDWSYKNREKPRAILLNKSNKLPLLWVVLSNQFSPAMSFANVRDRRGLISKALGFPYKEDHRKPKVIIYEPGKKEPLMYEGLLKYDNLADFFKKFYKGEADLSGLLKAVKEEKDAIPEMEMRHQEAEAIMQGKGYGNPHAGMADGPNPHDPEFMKAHGGGGGHPHAGMEGPAGANPHGHGHGHAGFNPHDPEFMKGHGGGGGHPHPGMGEEAQHPMGQGHSEAHPEEVPESRSNGADEEKEMGDEGEESVSDGLGRDTADEL